MWIALTPKVAYGAQAHKIESYLGDWFISKCGLIKLA